MSVKKGQDALLLWCQRNTDGYQGVHVTNFHNSWADGLAFCALIHKHRPERIQFDQLSKDNRAHNLGLAFKVAEDLGIPPLLDIEDITSVPKPEPLSIITYLSQYYHYFNKKRSSVNFDSEQDKKQKTDENSNQNRPAVEQELEKIPETAEEHGMCAKCGLELEGPVIETVGKAYHENCFGCFGCGKALLGKCLNVENNPYCESCGRKAFIESKLKKGRTLQKEQAQEPRTEQETSSTTTEIEPSNSLGSKAGKWNGVALFGMTKPEESVPESIPEQTEKLSSKPELTAQTSQEVPKEQTQQPPALPPKPAKEPTPEPNPPPKPGRPNVPIPKGVVPDDDDDDEDAPPSKPPPRPVPSKAAEPSKEPAATQLQEQPSEPSTSSTETSSTETSSQPPPLPPKPTMKPVPPIPTKPSNAAQLVASAQTSTACTSEPKKEKPALPAKPQTLKIEEEPTSSLPDESKRGSAIDYKKPLPQPTKKKPEPKPEEDSEDAPEVKVRISYRQSRTVKPSDIEAEAKKAAAEAQSAFATFPNLEGYVEKKGDVGVIKSWKRRYFKLRGDRMFYYTDEIQKDKDEPLGYIPLKDAKSIDPTPRMKGAFQIHTENPTRIWYLKVDTDEEMQKWIRACTVHSHYDSSTAPHKATATSQNTLMSLKLLSQPKEGYLNKLKGGLKHKMITLSKGSLGQLWSPRFFVVKDGILFKYDTKEAFEQGKPGSKLPLYKCSLEEYQEEINEGEGSENMFQITTTKGTIVLKASDEEEMHHWLNAIRKQQIMMDQIINDIEA